MAALLAIHEVESCRLYPDSEFEQAIRTGHVVFVSFSKEAKKVEIIEKIVATLAKVCEADVLLVPQTTLTSKLKGKRFQNHSALPKAEGRILWNKLVALAAEPPLNARHGRFGELQKMEFVTEGPHIRLLHL